MSPEAENRDTPQGLAFAVGAYFLWGFLPLYIKALSHMSPFEVVAHRIIWSVPIAGLLLVILGRTADLRAALRSPRTLAMGAVTATLITSNWAIYVWAISVDRTVDAALGYYINPLFIILLGAVLLGERPTTLQKVAIALATAAVLVLVFFSGTLPWAAFGLMLSWGFYALAKKSLPIGPNQGFLLEVLILLGPALLYVVWLGTTGEGHFGGDDTLWLLGCGVVTAVPLILYANGAKLLRLSTIGILQYIAPTMIFLVAVFVFGEQIDPARMIAFPMIWAALVLYSVSMVRSMRARV
ncbi:MAG: EamA family transporter RarD [Pseudomonadota bacterium]